MAQQYDNTNRGVLFKNKKKETDNHPDYKGKIDVDGTEYDLGAWLRTASESGEKYMSLKVSPMYSGAAKTAAAKPAQAGGGSRKEFDDEIPF